jgi:hypothetical protein
LRRELAGSGPGPKVSQKELSPENDPKSPEAPKNGFDAASCIRAGMAGIKVGMAIARAGSTDAFLQQAEGERRELAQKLAELGAAAVHVAMDAGKAH